MSFIAGHVMVDVHTVCRRAISIFNYDKTLHQNTNADTEFFVKLHTATVLLLVVTTHTGGK
jgi:hypothetical protein